MIKIQTLTSEQIQELKKQNLTVFNIFEYTLWFDKVKLGMFLVYFIFATVSTIHLYDLFIIGNHYLLAWFLCISVEIASFLIFVNWLENKSSILDFTFISLFLLQLFGNIFSIYANIKTDNFGLFSEFMGIETYNLFVQKRIYAVFTGTPIPIIILGLLLRAIPKKLKQVVKTPQTPLKNKKVKEPQKKTIQNKKSSGIKVNIPKSAIKKLNETTNN